jgi:hypothetical protein
MPEAHERLGFERLGLNCDLTITIPGRIFPIIAGFLSRRDLTRRCGFPLIGNTISQEKILEYLGGRVKMGAFLVLQGIRM